jgi:hypothetical protein
MKNILCMFVSGYTIGINNINNCSSMLNASSCARFSSCGWVKFYMVCFQVGCVMLCKDGDNFGTLPLQATKTWALGKNIIFLIGQNIIKTLQGGTRS